MDEGGYSGVRMEICFECGYLNERGGTLCPRCGFRYAESAQTSPRQRRRRDRWGLTAGAGFAIVIFGVVLDVGLACYGGWACGNALQLGNIVATFGLTVVGAAILAFLVREGLGGLGRRRAAKTEAGASDPTATRVGRWTVAVPVTVFVVVVLVAFPILVVEEAQSLQTEAMTQPCYGMPMGSALSLGTAQAEESPSTWYENLSLLAVTSTLTLNNVGLSVQTSLGSIVPAPAGSEVQLRGTSGLVATYTFSTAAWTGAALSTHVTNEETLSLVWPSTSSTDPMTGERLVVAGSNGYAGTIAVTLA